MTRPVLLVVVLALSLITTTAVAGVFLRYSAFSEPRALRILSSPLLTPSGSDVLGHLVVSVSGKGCVLEKIILIDKDGDSWEVGINKVLPSGSSVPIKFVVEGAADDFPVGFDYTGILISDAGTTYTVFASTIMTTSWGSVPEWSQFMHDAQNTGYAGGRTPTNINMQLWRVKLADSSQDILGGPILTHNGIVAVVEEEGPNGPQPRVYLIDPSTGDIKNSFALEWAGDPTFGPVAAFGLVFFATEDYVLAVDPVTGKTAWSVSSGEIGYEYKLKPDSSQFCSGYLGIYNDKLLMYTLYKGCYDGEGFKPAVLCFDALTGNILWKMAFGDGYRRAEPQVYFPAIAEGAIWFVDWYGTVWGINANDGSIILSFSTEKPIRNLTSPAYYHGYLFYIDINNEIVVINTSMPEVVWTYKFDKTVSSPVVAMDKVFTASKSTIFAFNYTTGKLLWSQQIKKLNSPLIVANGYVYAICKEKLYIFDAKNGNKLCEYPYTNLPNQESIAPSTCPFLYNNIIYFIGKKGGLFAITE